MQSTFSKKSRHFRENRFLSSGMEITVLIHDCSVDGEAGFAATCVEFPEANGQGETLEECLSDLRSAVADVLVYRGEEALANLGHGERLENLSA